VVATVAVKEVAARAVVRAAAVRAEAKGRSQAQKQPCYTGPRSAAP